MSEYVQPSKFACFQYELVWNLRCLRYKIEVRLSQPTDRSNNCSLKPNLNLLLRLMISPALVYPKPTIDGGRLIVRWKMCFPLETCSLKGSPSPFNISYRPHFFVCCLFTYSVVNKSCVLTTGSRVAVFDGLMFWNWIPYDLSVWRGH